MIKENPKIIRYKKIESIINKQKELKQMINELKTIQKQLVNAKEMHKTKSVDMFQQKYDQLLKQIETYPLMSEYLALQSEINDMLQAVKEIFEDGVNNALNSEWLELIG